MVNVFQSSGGPNNPPWPGAVGPAGPAGPAGVAGVDGSPGPAGVPGVAWPCACGGIILGATGLNLNGSAELFTLRFCAERIRPLQSGNINKLGCVVYNTYGNRNIQIGLYDNSGSLLASTAITTLTLNLHSNVSLGLTTPIVISRTVEYWIGVWGDGVALPFFETYPNRSATFPTGCHCVEDAAAAALPANIISGAPFVASVKAFGLNGGT